MSWNDWDEIAHIKATDTRTLLAYRDACCKFGGYYQIVDHGPAVHIENVKAELATREHIPNKLEAKALRRIMAQTGLTKEQVWASPKHRQTIAQANKQNAPSLDA